MMIANISYFIIFFKINILIFILDLERGLDENVIRVICRQSVEVCSMNCLISCLLFYGTYRQKEKSEMHLGK